LLSELVKVAKRFAFISALLRDNHVIASKHVTASCHVRPRLGLLCSVLCLFLADHCSSFSPLSLSPTFCSDNLQLNQLLWIFLLTCIQSTSSSFLLHQATHLSSFTCAREVVERPRVDFLLSRQTLAVRPVFSVLMRDPSFACDPFFLWRRF